MGCSSQTVRSDGLDSVETQRALAKRTVGACHVVLVDPAGEPPWPRSPAPAPAATRPGPRPGPHPGAHLPPPPVPVKPANVPPMLDSREAAESRRRLATPTGRPD